MIISSSQFISDGEERREVVTPLISNEETSEMLTGKVLQNLN